MSRWNWTMGVAVALAGLSARANSTTDTEYYRTDNCSGPLVAVSDANHPCEMLGAAPNRAWSIRKGDMCIDIVDTDTVTACRLFSSLDKEQQTLFFHTDNCTGPLVAAVDQSTECARVSAAAPVWSIHKNGKCIDIDDTDAGTACQRFK